VPCVASELEANYGCARFWSWLWQVQHPASSGKSAFAKFSAAFPDLAYFSTAAVHVDYSQLKTVILFLTCDLLIRLWIDALLMAVH